jgi:hypothetical protein
MGASLTGRIEHSCEDMMHVAIHVTVQLKDLTFDYTGRRILCLTYEMYLLQQSSDVKTDVGDATEWAGDWGGGKGLLGV